MADNEQTIDLEIEVQDSVSTKAAEAWAVGQRNGVDVPSTDPTYHNNAKWYAGQTGDDVAAAEAAAAAAAGSEANAEAWATGGTGETPGENNNAKYFKEQAEAAAAAAAASESAGDGSAKDAEAWAVGKRGGVDVPSTDPAYQNNAAYWAAQAHAITIADTYRLMADMLPGTTQEITFGADGNVQKITHKAGGTTEREDVFTFGTNTITETRTLDTGDVLTIVTNTETLATSVTVTAAA